MEVKKVNADPTKAFFVHTITRDIKLEDCILDLIDNSLDGARDLLGSPEPSLERAINFSKYEVAIEFSEEQFLIRDNCGGISLDDAINYAFTFGRREADDPDAYSIGVYGIGMKRSVFKLGDDIVIRSTRPQPKKGAGEEPFKVTIDVPGWLRSNVWDFDLDSAEPLSAPGVEIVVKSLRENISAEFSNPAFENRLRRILSRDYSRFIEYGLTIRVNGKKVKAFEFNLLISDAIKPFHGEFTLKGVRVQIIAGMAARPSDTQDPDDEGEKEDRSGWYVLCNDRMVLAADKSELTGWGYEQKNRWHPQYRGFIGIILFSAQRADQLPLTTTKRNIDRDHEIYKLALARMIELTRDWIDYTNRRKSALDEAKSIERTAVYVPAFTTPTNKQQVYPRLTSAPRAQDVTIQYSKPLRVVRELAQRFGEPGMSAREVGSKSFDYAHRELVGGGD
ncbi:MAG: hypothetical protein JWR84_4107 [Caulobacter sp.]|nr:hypothetical protein [Caulobacter sp.]